MCRDSGHLQLQTIELSMQSSASRLFWSKVAHTAQNYICTRSEVQTVVHECLFRGGALVAGGRSKSTLQNISKCKRIDQFLNEQQSRSQIKKSRSAVNHLSFHLSPTSERGKNSPVPLCTCWIPALENKACSGNTAAQRRSST